MIELRDAARENVLACVLLQSEDHSGHGLFESHLTSNAF